jgi:hypothetical protein
MQPMTLSVYTLDLSSDTMDQPAAIKGSLVGIQQMLKCLLSHNQNPPSVPASAALALVPRPDFSALTPAAKSVLRPNPPAIFDGDWT